MKLLQMLKFRYLTLQQFRREYPQGYDEHHCFSSHPFWKFIPNLNFGIFWNIFFKLDQYFRTHISLVLYILDFGLNITFISWSWNVNNIYYEDQVFLRNSFWHIKAHKIRSQNRFEISSFLPLRFIIIWNLGWMFVEVGSYKLG